MHKRFFRTLFLTMLAGAVTAVGMLGFTACEGTAGKDGAAGKDGKSAYDIWLEQGNTGTEQDFLDSLKGDPGLPGAPGSGWEVKETAPTEADGDIGDLWLNSTDWHVWHKEEDGWKDLGSIKGESAEQEPAGTEITIDQGATVEMPISVGAGLYVIEAEFGRAYTTLQAKVESNSSPSTCIKSESMSEAAGDDRNVLVGYIKIADSDTSISFSHDASQSLTATIKLKAYEQPKLKVGETVVLPLNSSDATINDLFKVGIGSSVHPGSYTVAISGIAYPPGVSTQQIAPSIYDPTGSRLAMLAPTGGVNWSTTIVMGEVPPEYLVFRTYISDRATSHYIVAVVVTITEA